MQRKATACAVAGIALACAAGYSLSLIAPSEAFTNLDLRGIYASAKQDRLPVTSSRRYSDMVMAFDLPSLGTTIVTKAPARPVVESAVPVPRSTPVRTVPVYPVREVPQVKKERLPEGCEPAFSPVTMPALAHIGARCDS